MRRYRPLLSGFQSLTVLLRGIGLSPNAVWRQWVLTIHSTDSSTHRRADQHPKTPKYSTQGPFGVGSETFSIDGSQTTKPTWDCSQVGFEWRRRGQNRMARSIDTK